MSKITFSDIQRKIIEHNEGPALVIAGPGSGKTAVCIERVKNLILKHKVCESSITVITFTKAAANEMKKRFEAAYSKNGEVNFATIHSLAFDIINYNEIEKKIIISERERLNLITSVISEVGSEALKPGKVAYEYFKEEYNSFIGHIYKKEIQAWDGELISKVINGYEPEYFNKGEFKKIWFSYRDKIKRCNFIDFEFMIIDAVEKLTKNITVKKIFAGTAKYLIIDEFQDTDAGQLLMANALSESGNVMVMGDDDQSIYGFRGAKPDIMNDFLKIYKGAEKYYLTENYRSARNIVSFSTKLINHNKNRFIKDIVPKNTSFEADGEVKVLPVEDEEDEYKKITAYLKNRDLKKSICLLARNNRVLKAAEEYFFKKDLNILTGNVNNNIFDKAVGKIILSYFKIAARKSDIADYATAFNISVDIDIAKGLGFIDLPTGEELDEYIWNRLTEIYFYDRVKIEKLRKSRRDFEFIRGINPFAAYMYIMKAMKLESFLAAAGLWKKNDIDILKSIICGMKNIDEIIYLSENFSDLYKCESQEGGGYDAVLSTIHASKGLEYDEVWIMRANDGVIPEKKAADSMSGLEEERRIFYVGATRAKEKLIISWCNKVRGRIAAKSRFIN